MITQTYIANHLEAQNSYQRSLHFHDINEIIFSLNNECSFFLGTHTYKISRGVLILIPEGTIHRKFNPSDLTIDTYTIHYPTSLLSAYSTPNTDLARIYSNTATCIQLPEDKIDLATRLFKRCLIKSNTAFGNDLRRNLRFLDLLMEFHTFFDFKTDATARTNPAGSARITELIKYIDAHLKEHLSLDDLANVFFTNKYSLCRAFKKETGFTIVEYINSNRIRLACSILREGPESTDVGAYVGFSNRSHFIRTFQHFTGVTPGNYSKQYRKFTSVPIYHNFSPNREENITSAPRT